MGIISAIFGEKGPVAPAAVPADPKTLPADGNYPNVFAVEKVFSIAPKPLDVGLKRSKQLRTAAWFTVPSHPALLQRATMCLQLLMARQCRFLSSTSFQKEDLTLQPSLDPICTRKVWMRESMAG